jgi:replicative DNA helicase
MTDQPTTPMHEMPRSDDAEAGVLSCFLQNPQDLLADAQASLPVDAFYHHGNRLIYEEMLRIHADARKSLDLVTFSQHLIDLGVMEKIGGPARLAELLGTVMTPAQYPFYKNILREKMQLRRIIAVCTKGIQECYEYQEDISALASRIEASFFEVVSAGVSGTGGQLRTLREAALDWMTKMEEHQKNPMDIRGMQTGFADYDRTTQGIDCQRGEIHVFAGRPGMGKTAFGVALIDHLAVEQNIPGAIWSMEMSESQMLDRLILGRRGIDVNKGLSGRLSREESKIVADTVSNLVRDNVFINEASELTCADLRSQAQLLKRKHGIQWIMVDHVHLLNPATKLGSENERMQLIEAMKTLQFIKKLGIGVILLVQMSQEADRKIGQLPVLADLPGSAAIGQFADTVSFLYRPFYYKPLEQVKVNEWKMWHARFNPHIENHPEMWADGSAQREAAGAFISGLDDDDKKNLGLTSYELSVAMENYLEHTALILRKNRVGPTPELMLRFEPQFMRFSGRTPKLYSNNVKDRQPGYESKPQPSRQEERPFD